MPEHVEPPTEERIGEITHYFQDINVAIVETDETLEVGDEVHVVGASDDFRFEVRSMELDHEPVEQVDAGVEVGIQVPQRAHEGSEVRRISPR